MNKNLSELKEIAKKYNIKGISKYRKLDLIELLKSKMSNEKVEGETQQKKQINGENKTEQKKEIKSENETSAYAIKKEGSVLREKISQKKYEGTNTSVSSASNVDSEEKKTKLKEMLTDSLTAKGVLEINENNNYGFLRCHNYLSGTNDVYVSPSQIRKFNLKTGDMVIGKIRQPNDGEKFNALLYVQSINGESPEKAIGRPLFEKLTPIYPNKRLRLESGQLDLTTRLMDIMSPIGKGQRGLIVAPPKAGKTTILKKIAKSLKANNPEINLIVLLIDERPEEVTDMQRSIEGEIVYSTFDEEPSHHNKVSEMALERAKRMVEQGQDVVILMDSLTRLVRSYNLTVTPTGRTLSGGLDPGALLQPKKFFGAARNVEGKGSLTILATVLVDTGSRMDDMIYEEFKGTGNMEVHLDRKLQERRIFPAIDIFKSGTRREDLLLDKNEYEIAYGIRKMMYSEGKVPVITEKILGILSKTKTNKDFIGMLEGNMGILVKDSFKNR
ncbi:transcription termination factor Rho [Oceanirhabdus seepicola]|uniref:Transcription termination factor Rho n=1 Tax=Oceanirhabdus seepicola TaxID=2828781 RepID=A0A9J6P0K3_9CLOT|nr:transcription termination factor Rho [Oceanirhabdus seepicola]